jgi:AcrR family transcriptional regulator
MLVITTMNITRDKIIQSALKLFSKKGFLGTTTKEIAKEAKIAEVTLFRYFNSKENLFIEVLRSQSFLPTLKDILPKIKKMEYKRALQTVAKYFLALLKNKKDLICIMHAEMFKYPAEIREINIKMIHEVYLVFASYLEDLKEKNVLKKDIDTTYASTAFFGMLLNLFIKKEFLKRKINFKKAVQTYIDIFYDGTRRIK